MGVALHLLLVLGVLLILVVAVVVVVRCGSLSSRSREGVVVCLFRSDRCNDCHPSVQSVHQYFRIQSPSLSHGQLVALSQ